jgi:nitroreductase
MHHIDPSAVMARSLGRDLLTDLTTDLTTDLVTLCSCRDRFRELVGPVAYDRLTADPELARRLTAAQNRVHLADSPGAVAELDAAAAGYLAAGSPSAAAVTMAAAGVIAQEDGRLAMARERFASSIQAAECAGNHVAFAVSALGLGGVWVHEHRSTLERTRVRELQRRALASLDADEPLALRLRARLAAEDDYLTPGSGRLLGVLAEVRTGSEPSVLADALSLAHHCRCAGRPPR